MRPVVALLLLLTVAIQCEDPGSIKVIHEGNYRVNVNIIQLDLDPHTNRKWLQTYQEIVPVDFKRASADETAISATRAEPYVLKLENTTDKVVVNFLYAELSNKTAESQPRDWRRWVLNANSFYRVSESTWCYWLGGTVDEPEWTVRQHEKPNATCSFYPRKRRRNFVRF